MNANQVTDNDFDNENSLFNKANELVQNEMFDEAIKCYENILEYDAFNVRALHAMAVIAFHKLDVDAAIEYLQQVIHMQPDYATAYRSLGKIQKNLGRLLAAKYSYLKALEIEPASYETLCSLGTVYKELNQYDVSEEFLNKALTIDSASSLAYFEFGSLHLESRNYDSAIQYFTKAIELKPDFADAYAKLSLIYVAQGRSPEAYDCLNKCLEFRPESLVIRTIMAFCMNYLLGVKPGDIFNVSTEWGRLAANKNPSPFTKYHNLPDASKQLRIGFVSPDFRRHPVGYFVQSFMMLYDRDSFEVIGYSDVKNEDELTVSLIESADKWRRVYGIKDDKLAEMIRRDRIDILIDLAGHTKDNRLNTFIMKPAPIQVTWAGYVGTTGVSSIDYLISDRYQSPEDAEAYTVERIIRMPADYICYTPPEFAPAVAPLPALNNGYVTFGCFNNLAKISEDAVMLWSEILNSVRGAKIFLKNPSFNDKSTVERYLQLFEAHGISEDRIITEGQSPPEEMMGRYSLVDIQLDTMPYSGGLTTLESIWMGVPVVTLPGVLFSSRHSFTHLMNIGLSEYIASSREEYVAIACRLAADLTSLSEVRMKLRDLMGSSPVCDGFEFTGNLQCVFRYMWSEWCENEISDFNDNIGNCEKNEDVEEVFIGDHIAYNDLGNRYSEDGNYDEAIKCYKMALDIKPGYVEAYYNMGLVWHKVGNFKEAVRLYNLVICLSPDFAEAYKLLTDLYIESGNMSFALMVCNQAIDLLPGYPDIYDKLGEILMELGQVDNAQDAFRKALELKADYIQPQSPISPSHCATIGMP